MEKKRGMPLSLALSHQNGKLERIILIGNCNRCVASLPVPATDYDIKAAPIN